MWFKKIKLFFRKKKEENNLLPDNNSEDDQDNSLDHKSSNTTIMEAKNTSHSTINKTTSPEFKYLEELILRRLDRYFPPQNDEDTNPVKYKINEWVLPIKEFILNNKLDQDAATLLLIGLAPHVQPDIFDNAIESKLKGAVDFPKLGGV